MSAPVGNLGNTGTFDPTANTPTAKQSTLNMETFMRLLTVQLENQNPLNPMSDTDFFAQMAQMGQVQGMDDLKASMEVQKAQSLMGKTVTAAAPAGATTTNGDGTITGVVQSLTIKNGAYLLNVQEADGGTVQIGIDSIQSVNPTSNLTGLQDLIGKDVIGMINTTKNGVVSQKLGEGTVLQVYSQNGANFALVDIQGQNVAMNINDIVTIAPGKTSGS